MPIKFVQQVEESLWLGVWEINEQENELMQLSGEALLPDNYFSLKSEVQRKQSLCGRLLVKHLAQKVFQQFYGIYKNENGKPFLTNLHGFVSISHSKQFAAATLSTKSSTGVDIEAIRPRILKVIPRVTSEEEFNHIHTETEATLYWCAKEALYKLYDQPGLDFAKQLQVKKIADIQFTGLIVDEESQLNVQFGKMEFEGFMLVYAF